MVTTLFTDPRNAESAIEQADPIITLLFAAAGIVVWQLGKTYALFVTLPRAAGRAAGRQLDTTKIASEVQDGLDDRPSDLEDDLAETKRAVRALEGDGQTTTFDETDRLEGETDRPSELEPATAETNPPPSSPSDDPRTESADDGPANDRSATGLDDDTEPADETGDDADDPLA
ncbi:hypothetical protein C488_09509 [Natrinema pellirubrum DSM 15624]|uniref:Uncharacterized protein n=1 Tax=Natrinema pellirubrum (strain DSM 15624 / CIP 106293 / JCM 10476 / NCIMB 786 / 157) TaxID=797303 RepID=L0JQJ2_NATP1|nr:hypothetical protein [Natrinema pellirubrum]AGB32877.1 hypothetical protein Natpe_3084 [Natrinema pellirubrum DSM 15624]ELY75637.1 hypothetical protein C488_09509 [Natrinema pellirubrum DSM 15624]